MEEYEEVWAQTYGKMKFRIAEEEPLDNSVAKYCLKVVRERKEDFIGISSRKFKLHLFLDNPPRGDIINLLREEGFDIPENKDLRRIMAFLAKELNGTLLSDLSGKRWLLIV